MVVVSVGRITQDMILRSRSVKRRTERDEGWSGDQERSCVALRQALIAEPQDPKNRMDLRLADG
jgi:hypothetical protein